MKLKKLIFVNLLLFLVFTCFITPVIADFELGDSKLPIDEDGFIEYDFEDNVASALSKVKAHFVEIYKFYDIITGIGVNITVSEQNSDSNTYDVLIVDDIRYQHLTFLLYNKTHQYFVYAEFMNNLLIEGYGGYFVIPNDPVDVNIVKGYVESYTVWSANVTDNTITINIANIQAILTYSDHGILLKEEIKSNNEIISTLALIEKDEEDDLVLIISIISIIGAASVILPIGIILYKKSS